MQVFVKDSGNALKFYEQAFDKAALAVYPSDTQYNVTKQAKSNL